MTTTLSSKGQIVIPAPIRERHGFRVGDELLIEEREDEIVLKKARHRRKKSLVQWMLDCPAGDFKIERVRDLPKKHQTLMFLADTDLISEPRQKRPNPQVLQWLRAHDHELFLSAISVGEIKKGVELYPDGRKKTELSAWLEGLLEDFTGCVLPFTEAEALTWGKLYATAQKAGRKPPGLDSLNAAIALHHGLTLVTRNEADYAGTGIKIANPWK